MAISVGFELNEDDTMDILLDRDSNWWAVARERALFNPNAAYEIMNVIIFPSSQPEKWFWTLEKSGLSSVRSAYKLIRQGVQKFVGECSSASLQQDLWKAKWKMQVPNKIKVFAWRACKDSLPTQNNLKRIISEEVCCFCHAVCEDLVHALISCPSINDHWEFFMSAL